MRRLLLLLVAGGAIGGGGWFLQHYHIEGFDRLRFNTHGLPTTASGDDGDVSPAAARRTLRIASFKVHELGTMQLGQSRVRQLLAEVLRSFDILALEGLDVTAALGLPEFVDTVNTAERRFECAVGPIVGRHTSGRMAFIFDADRVELDRSGFYAVADPDGLLAPPIGWLVSRQGTAGGRSIHVHLDGCG